MTELPRTSHKANFAPIAIILVSITLLVMGRLCFNEFVLWDDNDTVSLNPLLNPPCLATLPFYWLHTAHRIYAPLTYSIWAALALIARVAPDPQGITLDPLIFHSANLFLHLLAALVVCKILLLIRMNRFAALCGSLFFSIHPIQVEAVAWVSGLKDVLSGVLALTALWQYLVFALDAHDGKRPKMPLLLCIACLILAMLAKSSAATIPLAAIALDRSIMHRPWKSILLSTGLLVIAAVPFIVIATIAQSTADIAPTPPWQRPLIAADAITFYLSKLVWPINLCIDYGRTPWMAMHQPWIEVIWIVPLAIAVALIMLPKHAQPLMAAALVFLAGCLPTLGLTTFATQFFSTTADHYLYWAMLGPAIAVAWTLTAFPRPLALRAGVVAAIVGLAILSIRQGAFWKDDFSLFEHAAAVNPKSFLAYNNLGNAYYREMNALLAADNFRGAIDARPDYFLAHSNLAAALHELGRLDESTRELQISIKLQREKPWRLRTSWVVDLNHLGQNLLDSGQPSQAAAALRESLAARPDQSDIIALLARADTATSQPASRPASSSVAP